MQQFNCLTKETKKNIGFRKKVSGETFFLPKISSELLFCKKKKKNTVTSVKMVKMPWLSSIRSVFWVVFLGSDLLTFFLWCSIFFENSFFYYCQC